MARVTRTVRSIGFVRSFVRAFDWMSVCNLLYSVY